MEELPLIERTCSSIERYKRLKAGTNCSFSRTAWRRWRRRKRWRRLGRCTRLGDRVQGRNLGAPGNVHSHPVLSPAGKPTNGDFRLRSGNDDRGRAGSAYSQRNGNSYDADAKWRRPSQGWWRPAGGEVRSRYGLRAEVVGGVSPDSSGGAAPADRVAAAPASRPPRRKSIVIAN
jgi:hypothetical protein